jgi:hypothetical protein
MSCEAGRAEPISREYHGCKAVGTDHSKIKLLFVGILPQGGFEVL